MGLNGGRTVCVLGLLGLMLLAGVAAPTRAAGGGVQPELPITNRIEAITRIVQQMDARLAAILEVQPGPVQPPVADALRELRSAAAGMVNLASAVLGDGFTCGDGMIPPPGTDTGTIDATTDDDLSPSIQNRLNAVANILTRANARLTAIRDGISSPPGPTTTASLQSLRATAISLVERATHSLNDAFPCGGPTGG